MASLIVRGIEWQASWDWQWVRLRESEFVLPPKDNHCKSGCKVMDRRLHNAAMSGDVESVTQVMADVNRPEILSQVTRGLNNTALHLAAKKGHAEFVSNLLSFKPCILLVANSKQETALHAAARNGAAKVVEVLLRIPSDSHAQCRCASCVQSDATAEAEVEQNPIDSECFFTAQNSKGNTTLHMAARGGHPEVVHLLSKKERGLACLVNKAREAPLFTAAQNGHLDIVKRPLGIATPICDTDNGGRTPLHTAIHTPRLGQKRPHATAFGSRGRSFADCQKDIREARRSMLRKEC